MYINLIKLLKDLNVALENMFLKGENISSINLGAIKNVVDLIDSEEFLNGLKEDILILMLGVLGKTNEVSIKESGIWDEEYHKLINFVISAIEVLKLKIYLLKNFFELRNLILISKTEDDINNVQLKFMEIIETLKLFVDKGKIDLDEKVFKTVVKLLKDFENKLVNDNLVDSLLAGKVSHLRELMVAIWLVLRWSKYLKLDWVNKHNAQLLLEVLNSDTGKREIAVENIIGMDEYMGISGVFIDNTLNICQSNISDKCLKYLIVSYKFQILFDIIVLNKLNNLELLDKVEISREDFVSFKEWLDANIDVSQEEFEVILDVGNRRVLSAKDILEIMEYLFLIIDKLTESRSDDMFILGIFRNLSAKLGIESDNFLNNVDEISLKKVKLRRLQRELSRKIRIYNNLKGKTGKAEVGRAKGVISELNNLRTEINQISSEIYMLTQEIQKLESSRAK